MFLNIMDEEERLDDHNSGQRCRLCLHCIEDALCAEQLFDIFSFDESLNSTLADKIRDCLGLCINPGDAVSNVCLNCVHTIKFIDEFRLLCYQTEKIYESTQFDDVLKWQCYNNLVSELRTLVRGQRNRVDSILDDTFGNSAVGDIDSPLSTEFIKVEDEQTEETIYVESVSLVKNEEDSNEPIQEVIENSDVNPTTANDRDSKFQLKLKIAHELQAQMCGKPDFKAASRKLNLGFHEIKHLWRAMKKFYIRCKKRAYAGYEDSIFRCRRCPLFNVMNILIPKFDGDKPFNERKISSTRNCNGRKIPIDLKVAIVEEIKAHPELWDISLNSSAYNMKIIWEEMTRRFAMDIRTLRTHWRSLREFYRAHKLRELKGIQKRDSANEKLDYLLSVLHEILGTAMNIRLPENSIEQSGMPEEEIGKVVEEEKDEGQFHQKKQQLALALEVQQYPIIWCYKHQDFHSTKMRAETWKKIAETFATDCETVKREWGRLKDMFRNRHLRLLEEQIQSDDALVVEHLYEALSGMFRKNMQQESKNGRTTDEETVENDPDERGAPYKKFDEETLLKFAKVCYDNDILWNTSHSDYNALDKRDELWDLIALQFDVSLETIKHEWKNLRGIYRSRYLRYKNGLIEKNNKTLNTPLHQLTKSMFEDHMLVGMRSFGVFPKGFKRNAEPIQGDTVGNKPFSTSEDRVKLVEQIAKYDILWNAKNSDYKKSALREPLFVKIAANFNHPPSVIKAEWKRLRRMHQNRQHRIALGRVDSIQDGVDPLHTVMDKLLSPKPKATGDDTPTNDEREYPKRRFAGKRSFSDDGCIKIDVNGTLRYAKVCELCGKQVERSYFEYHMNSHRGLTPYACSFEGCNKKYSNKVTRDRHEVIIHGEDGYVFQCDQCDMKFKQKAKYRYHYAVKHKSEEVPCKVCGKVFKHNNLLRKHMDIHASNYECHVCGKVLQKKYTLNVHMRVHTKEKPFPCELCEQRFMLKVQMKTHLLKVHGMVLEELQAATTASKN